MFLLAMCLPVPAVDADPRVDAGMRLITPLLCAHIGNGRVCVSLLRAKRGSAAR